MTAIVHSDTIKLLSANGVEDVVGMEEDSALMVGGSIQLLSITLNLAKLIKIIMAIKVKHPTFLS